MTRNKTIFMTTMLAISALTAAVAIEFAGAADKSPTGYQQLARHGADDPAGDDRGGKRGGQGADDPAGHASITAGTIYQLARHGADDPAGDDRGGKRGGQGADDPAGHASITAGTIYQLARHGADDPAGHA